MYSVSESEGMVQICINAEGVTIPCSITHPFQVILSSSHESAGIVTIAACGKLIDVSSRC